MGKVKAETYPVLGRGTALFFDNLPHFGVPVSRKNARALPHFGVALLYIAMCRPIKTVSYFKEEMKMKSDLTDEQVELEIERLSKSPLVKLARKEQRLKNARRQNLYIPQQEESSEGPLQRLSGRNRKPDAAA